MNRLFEMSCNFLAALLIFVNLSFGQSGNVLLHGIAIDVENNKPVSEANIELVELKKYSTSDNSGNFYFKDLPFGDYTLNITHVSYKENYSVISINEKSRSELVIYLIPKVIEIAPVVVTDFHSHTKFDDLSELSNVLKGKELQKELGITLAATLKNETGLAIRAMGPAPARPVIRGLGGDRVMISEDGEKTTDLSSTSPDHAVTIEPFSAERIEVMRGPKVLLYTPTTIGGVVNVIRHEIPQEYHHTFSGSIGAYGESANNGFLGSVVAEAPVENFMLKVEGSRRKTEDLSTPAGKLMNSNSTNLNYSGGLSYFSTFGMVGASFKQFELDYGVPGGFVGAHPFGVDIEMLRRQINLEARINIRSKLFKDVEASFYRSYYRHKEFEFGGLIGSEYKLENYLGKIHFNHKQVGIFDRGIWGSSFEFRKYDIGGYVFNPPANSFNLSIFAFETLSTGKFSFELGARYNFDKIKPEYEKPNARIGYIRERTFHTYSLSASILYEWTKIVSIGANISKSSRVPTIEELYSEGPHLAAYSFEVGNPDLEAEGGFGSEVFIYHKFNNLYYNFNLFANSLDNYIIPRNSGDFNFQTLLPIYRTEGVGALLYGAEGQINWGFYKNLTFGISASYTIGEFKNSNAPLPQIPPVKGLVELKYSDEDFTLGISSEFAGSQNRVDEFEEPTAGYIVMNAFTQYSFQTLNLIHVISLNVDNIFDKEYRNHLSRVKSILPEAGTNARLTYKMFFEF